MSEDKNPFNLEEFITDIVVSNSYTNYLHGNGGDI